jgi:3',5'-cyclic AMP phosphodiesterase CpdA
MRILAISDISWNSVYLRELTRKIERIHPDLVLLAGDLVNDMIGFRDGNIFSADKYWDDVYELFNFLNERKLQTFYIRGNWDVSQKSNKTLKLAAKKLPYVKDISETVEEFRGLTILGLSYAFTNSLEGIRFFSEKFQRPLDLVLAHAEYKRRIWLCHLNTKLIITGHFDNQLCRIQDKVFISLDNFPSQYVVIDYKSRKFEIRYVNKTIGFNVLRRASFDHGNLVWKAKPLQSLRPYSDQYANQVETLMEAKTRLDLDRTQRELVIDALLKRRIPKRHIEEYLRVSIRSKKTSNKQRQQANSGRYRS